MASEVKNAAIEDTFYESLSIPANNATKTVFAWREEFDEVQLYSDVVFRVALVARVEEIWFYDASATAGSRWKNLLDDNRALSNRTFTGGTGTTLDSWATADFLYVGTTKQHLGFDWQMTSSVNGTNSVLTMEYSKSNVTFTATAITDGTISGSATMAQDGNVDINTLPTDWTKQDLSKILDDEADNPVPAHKKLYWVRFDVDTALDTDTEIEALIPYHHTTAVSTNSGAAYKAQLQTTYTFRRGQTVGGLQLSEFLAVGSKTVDANWVAYKIKEGV